MTVLLKFILLLFISFIYTVYSAKIETLHKSDAIDRFFKNDDPTLKHEIGFKTGFTKFLLSKGISVKEVKAESYSRANKRIRFEQYYKGIPVYGTDVILHQITTPNQGVDRFAVGKVVTGLEKDLYPVYISKLRKKEKDILAQFIQDKTRGKSDFKVVRNKSNVIIYVDKNSKAQLGYFVSCTIYYENDLPYKPKAILNEQGEEVRLWNAIKYAKSKGFASGPGGNSIIGRYQYNGKQRPLLEVRRIGELCYMETDHIITVHNYWEYFSDSTTPYTFVCPEQAQSYIHGGFSPLNDGHYNAGKVIEMFKMWYGDYPLDKKPLIVRVHVARNLANAMFDEGELMFGDGHCEMTEEECPTDEPSGCQQWHPTASSAHLAAHEMGHGVIYHYSNLETEMGDALHESFGDMTAKGFERFMNGSKITDWRIATDILKIPLRCMDNPKCDDASLDNCNEYDEEVEPHHAAGIFNKAFYLIAQTLANDAKGAYDLFYCANANFWYKMLNFGEAAELVLKAAELLKDSSEKGVPWCVNTGNYADLNVAHIVNAFKQVGFKCTKFKDVWNCNCCKGDRCVLDAASAAAEEVQILS